MAFCANCGAQMVDGDKFCGNCGTVMPSENSAQQPNFQPNYQPNVQANFQNQQAPNYSNGYVQPQMASQSPSNFAIAMEELGKELSAFFKNPMATISKVRFQMSSLATYIFAGFTALVLILLNFWKAGQRFSKLESLSNVTGGDFMEDILGFSLGTSKIKTGSTIGYGKLFLASFFFILIILATIWGLTLLVNSVILKGQLNAIQAMNVVIFSAIPYAIVSAVAIIFGYVEANLAYMIYLAGIMASIVLLYKAISSNINKPESIALYSFLMIPVLVYLVNFIYFKVIGTEIAFYYSGIFMGI